jgi:CRP-like cAMP-binding protein
MAPPHTPPPLDDPDLQTLATRGIQKRYRTNALLIEEGDVGDTIFIILEGAVKVFAADPDGREIIFNEQRRGDYLGEMSLDGGPRSASVVATEPTICSRPTSVRTLRSRFDCYRRSSVARGWRPIKPRVSRCCRSIHESVCC